MTSTRIVGDVPLGRPPAWALLQRELLARNGQVAEAFFERYTGEEDALRWRDSLPGHDAGDDFYESYFNWPVAWLLGGADSLADLSARGWEGVTRQLARLGQVADEYFDGYDWFHQSEANVLLYGILASRPHERRWRERAARFASGTTRPPNYDARANLFRSPHPGARGPRLQGPRWGSPAWAFEDPDAGFGVIEGLRPYGLPLEDVPGVRRYGDLADPAHAAAMLAAMDERMGRGDSIMNLASTGLVAMAFLVTGDERLRDWALRYVDGWERRWDAGAGVLPDNVGPSGRVGELHGGRWWGGHYGWRYPHGLYSIAHAVLVAAQSAVLLTGDERHLDLARDLLDAALDRGEVRHYDPAEGTLGYHVAPEGARRELVVPYRHGDGGWFDPHPMWLPWPVALWTLSLRDDDWQRIERLRSASGADWKEPFPGRVVGDIGHEAPWLRFLAGENPGYPEAILRLSLADQQRRTAMMRADDAAPETLDEHHWQFLNPVSTEALLQLTVGAPQPLQNGGLLIAPLRYFDRDRRRPGLPEGVAALVEELAVDRVGVRLVNLDPVVARGVTVQAGAFAEHRIATVAWTARSGTDWPGAHRRYGLPAAECGRREQPVGSRSLDVELLPGCEIRLSLTIERYAGRATPDSPF